MQIVVLLNQRAGAPAASDDEPIEVRTRKAFEAVGVVADVRSVQGDQLHNETKAAIDRGVAAVVAAGGDGTINAVASALAGTQTPLGVLPMGTLNHFAKDLGLPLDLNDAVRVIADGNSRYVDVGRINERIFLNNSSLGVYARALIGRDARRDRGVSKWPAMFRAALRTFWRSPMVHVQLDTAGHTVDRKTPLVFIGNNRYLLDLLNVGARERLDAGELSLYIATTTTRCGMLKIMVRAALGLLEQSRDFETQMVKAVAIESRRNHLPVAIDGEIVHMTTPLQYSIWPKSLQVLVGPLPEDNRPASQRKLH
jgi:diacylglycerol kinase family enzyme